MAEYQIKTIEKEIAKVKTLGTSEVNNLCTYSGLDPNSACNRIVPRVVSLCEKINCQNFSFDLQSYSFFWDTVHHLSEYKEECTRRAENTLVSPEEKFIELIVDVCQYIKEHSKDIKSDMCSLIYDLNQAALKGVNEQKKECQKINEEIAGHYSKFGVNLFTKDYNDVAENEKKAKNGWLILSLVLLAAIFIVFFNPCGLLFSVKNYMNTTITSPYDELFIKYIVRMPFVVFFFFSFFWASRRYIKSRELHITYRHLGTLMTTYKAFYDHAKENDKSLVLLEAVKTAFPAPVDRKTEASLDNVKMFDVLKLMLESMKKPEQ